MLLFDLPIRQAGLTVRNTCDLEKQQHQGSHSDDEYLPQPYLSFSYSIVVEVLLLDVPQDNHCFSTLPNRLTDLTK